MSDVAAVGTLADLGRLLLRRPKFLQADRDVMVREIDEYAAELRKVLSAIVAEHQFAQSPVSGLAVITAAMLIRDEVLAIDGSAASPTWEETSRAIRLALASV